MFTFQYTMKYPYHFKELQRLFCRWRCVFCFIIFHCFVDPGKILNLISSVTTTSISLNWTPPSGYVLSYKVEWLKSDSHPSTIFVVEPWALLSGLIPGSSYNITITAVARDNATLGESYSITNVTGKPKVYGDDLF